MRILITGASGQLGGYLLRALRDHGGEVVAWSRSRAGELFGRVPHPIDLADARAVEAAFDEARPEVVIHAAAMARVSDCHADPEKAHRVNAAATATLAGLAARRGARFVYVSTDLVFGGDRGRYAEADAPSPLSEYGRSKAAGEVAALAVPRAVVARVSLLYGPSLVGRPTFFDEQVAALRGGRPVTLFADEHRSPLDLASAAVALLELAKSGFVGVLHVGGPERISRLEMGQRLAEHLGLAREGIVAMRRDEAPAPEPRPRDVSLDSSRWRHAFPTLSWPTYGEALLILCPVTPVPPSAASAPAAPS
jgi:dTDP-4-dehydrorhamnose reductase